MPLPTKDQTILKLGLVLLLAYHVSATGKTQVRRDTEGCGDVLSSAICGSQGFLPWGSAFLKALPASTKQVAASCLLCSCRCSWAAWQKAFPAAGTEQIVPASMRLRSLPQEAH